MRLKEESSSVDDQKSARTAESQRTQQSVDQIGKAPVPVSRLSMARVEWLIVSRLINDDLLPSLLHPCLRISLLTLSVNPLDSLLTQQRLAT